MKPNYFIKTALAILLSSCCASAQSNWPWAIASFSTTGTTGDQSHSTCTDQSGNVFIAGCYGTWNFTLGTTTFTNYNSNTPGPDIFLAKYDSLGNFLWARQAGGNRQDVAYSISCDQSGYAYITGSFIASAAFGSINLTTPSLATDVFVAKYDPAGNVVWAHRFGGTGGDASYGISSDIYGGIYLTGWFQDSITFGNTTFIRPGAFNYFVAKLDSAGNALWAKCAGGANYNQGTSARADMSGNVYVAGRFWGPNIIFGPDTFINQGSDDIFLVKYDLSGNLLWARTAGEGATLSDKPYSVCIDPWGNAIITGDFQSQTLTFGSATLTNDGYSDIFIVKYDPLGNILWEKSAGGVSNEFSASASTDHNGNIFVSGLVRSDSILYNNQWLYNSGSWWNDPLLLLKLDPNGNLLCSESLESGGVIGYQAVCNDNFGNAYVTGGFGLDPFFVGPNTLHTNGNIEIYLAKYTCSPASVKELNSNFLFRVYPNSGSGTFIIETDLTDGEISIINTLGEIILKTEINAKQMPIDLSGQPAGIYFVILAANSQIYSAKFIKN
jgi:hypothetical protein